MGEEKVAYHKSTHRHWIFGRSYIECWSLKAWWNQDAKKPPVKVPKKILDSRRARR